MDAMYRRKSQTKQDTVDTHDTHRKPRHAADDYNPRLRPRESHADFVDSKKRINGNLNQLNKSVVERPVVENEDLSPAETSEDRGIRIKATKVASKSPIPYAYILSLFLLAVVLMYVVSLFVEVQEYSRTIDEMESRIAELKEESTRLEVQLESRYDLDEVERIATQEYGMVVSSTLPKKYISISEDADLWQEVEKEEPEETLVEQIVAGVRKFLGKNEE